MNLTITQDNTRTETINSSIIDKLYEIAFAASSDPNSTVSLTGRLESPKGYAVKVEWLNTNFSPDLTITVPTSGLYILFEDSAVESLLISGGFSTDGTGISLTDAANATFTSSTFLGNTDITSFPEFNLFTKANTNPPNSLFSGCSNLAEIDFSAILKIGLGEFKKCSSLTGDLRLPNLSEFSGNGAFRECTGITKISNLGSITSLPLLAFRECTGITEVTIPSTCTTLLDWGVFNNCSNLTKVIGLENLTKIIGSYLFSGCDLDLTTLPSTWNIIQIGPDAFNSSKIHGEINCPKISLLGDNAFWGCGNITKLKCLGKLTQIPGGLIASWNVNNSLFTEAYIPFECTSIGGQAFRACENMTTIKLYTLSVDDWVEGLTPTYTNISKVTTFGNECFRGCSSLSLTNADVANAITIGNRAFQSCTASFVGNLSLPNIETLEESAFNNTGVTSVTLGSSLRTIAATAFQNCTILKIIIPEGCLNITGGQYLSKNDTLRYVEFSSTVTNMGYYFHRAFEGSSLNSIYIVIKATTPPALSAYLNLSNAINTSRIAGIYVPVESLIAYLNATGEWANTVILLKLKPISKLQEDSPTWWTEYLTRVNP